MRFTACHGKDDNFSVAARQVSYQLLEFFSRCYWYALQMQSPAKLWSSESRLLYLKRYMVIVTIPFYTEGKLAKSLVQGHRASQHRIPRQNPRVSALGPHFLLKILAEKVIFSGFLFFFNVIVFCPAFQTFMLMSVSGTVKVKKQCTVLRYQTLLTDLRTQRMFFCLGHKLVWGHSS